MDPLTAFVMILIDFDRHTWPLDWKSIRIDFSTDQKMLTICVHYNSNLSRWISKSRSLGWSNGPVCCFCNDFDRFWCIKMSDFVFWSKDASWVFGPRRLWQNGFYTTPAFEIALNHVLSTEINGAIHLRGWLGAQCLEWRSRNSDRDTFSNSRMNFAFGWISGCFTMQRRSIHPKGCPGDKRSSKWWICSLWHCVSSQNTAFSTSIHVGAPQPS